MTARMILPVFHWRNRITVIALVVTLLAMLLTVMNPISPAYADDCGGAGSFGCDSGNDNGGGNGTGGSGIKPGPAPAPGGGSAPSDPFLRIDRIIPDQGMCPYRPSDGKSAIGVDIYWTTIFAYGGKETPPNTNYYWKNPVYTPGYGYLWDTEVFVKSVCLYPPMTYLMDQTCYISSYSDIWIKEPKVEKLASRTTTSGYSQGSMDYNACKGSNSKVNLGIQLPGMGFYSSDAYSLAQIATVEVAYTPDGITGVIPPPKIIGLSGVFKTAPKHATISIPCTGIEEQPGVSRPTPGAWTETPCLGQTYTCSVNSATVNGFPNFAEAMGDGTDNEFKFNQSITGTSLNIQEKKTTILRSENSSPWNPELKPNKNFVELDVVNDAGVRKENVLTNKRKNTIENDGLTTQQFDGQLDTVYLIGHTEGKPWENDGRTTITQSVWFKGTISKGSAYLDSLDTAGSGFATSSTVVTTPTEGLCEQSASTAFKRAHGDYVE